ncbi:hypothetical protein Taro_027677 [Colocasia esculenta]|uniref:Uncharacterized protein n=1 Tax=Colocasia esculenta TaxID=4460 RepID=A0A843VEI2_COLES|nr:hypothetical protein [Colocasia esculenta]
MKKTGKLPEILLKRAKKEEVRPPARQGGAPVRPPPGREGRRHYAQKETPQAYPHCKRAKKDRSGTTANKSHATQGLAESLTCASLNRPHVLGRKSLASVGVLSSAIGSSRARP